MPQLANADLSHGVAPPAPVGTDIFIADQVAPVVPVEQLHGELFTCLRSAWGEHLAADIPPGRAAVRAGWRCTTVAHRINERGLEVPLPDSVDYDVEGLARAWLLRQLLLDREIRVETIVTDTAIWANAAAPLAWSNVAAKPVADLLSMCASVQASAGRWPTVVAIPGRDWANARARADVDRIASANPAIPPAAALANYLEVERVVIGAAQLASQPTGTESDTTYTPVWTGGSVWAGVVEQPIEGAAPAGALCLAQRHEPAVDVYHVPPISRFARGISAEAPIAVNAGCGRLLTGV